MIVAQHNNRLTKILVPNSPQTVSRFAETGRVSFLKILLVRSFSENTSWQKSPSARFRFVPAVIQRNPSSCMLSRRRFSDQQFIPPKSIHVVLNSWKALLCHELRLTCKVLLLVQVIMFSWEFIWDPQSACRYTIVPRRGGNSCYFCNYFVRVMKNLVGRALIGTWQPNLVNKVTRCTETWDNLSIVTGDCLTCFLRRSASTGRNFDAAQQLGSSMCLYPHQLLHHGVLDNTELATLQDLRCTSLRVNLHQIKLGL